MVPFLPLSAPVILMLFNTASASFTVTEIFPDFPPASAVMVTVPAFMPVTLPPSTVAILVSEDDHLMPS